MKYLPAVLGAVLASAITTACHSQPSEGVAGADATTETPAKTPARLADDSAMQSKESDSMRMGGDVVKDDAQAFVPAGAKLLETSKGDLNGDGIEDVLLVIDPPAPGTLPVGEEGPNRILMLVLGSADGKWLLAARNDKLVPCSTCGGVMGDPFGYARVSAGSFTVVNSGGSRERWTDSYTFRYAPADKAWWLEGVSRQVIDTDTDAENKRDFTAAELGKVRFEDFDPSSVPAVTLP
ncbi:MAG: hypothetical protein ACOH1V_00640 [Stenotrophomonas sp.]